MQTINFPPLPDAHALAAMLLTAVALALFMRDKVPLETSSMVVIAALTIGFTALPYQAGGKPLHAVEFLNGFGHEALVAVCVLMVVGQGLVRTGALEPLGRVMARLWGAGPLLAMLVTLTMAAMLSAFVNNTPIVVLLLPVLISVSLRAGTPTSGVLMPMGLATLIGGTGTTIGTSTNLLVVSVAADMGLPTIGMFDFFVPAAMASIAGILYLSLVAPHLLPDRSTPLMDASPRIFSAQLRIREDSVADGMTLRDATARAGKEMRIIRILRGKGTYVLNFPDTVLRPDDRLLLTDTPKNLKQYESALGGTLYSGDVEVDEEHPLTAEDQQISEVVVVDGSPIEGWTLKQLHFVERYQLVVLAQHRGGKEIELSGKGMDDVTLEAGDVLLVQGPAEQIASLRLDDQFLVLDATTDLPHVHKSPTAILIMASVILVAAFGLLPIAVSAMAGVLLLVVTRCLNWREVGEALNAQVILIVVASLGLGAAVIGTPIAVGIAQQIGQPPEAFVVAVIFGSNLCYATPLAHKINVLVMAAGGLYLRGLRQSRSAIGNHHVDHLYRSPGLCLRTVTRDAISGRFRPACCWVRRGSQTSGPRFESFRRHCPRNRWSCRCVARPPPNDPARRESASRFQQASRHVRPC